MKESITQFDLESAFKALDEIDIPVANKVRANRPALTEIFSRKSKFDSLMEEYYDISNTAELDDAKEAREAEVAKAKLARIEKIVDLDADSPEDLLTSYVGKYIMQCPQCMTLFYKDQEDIVEDEEDPSTVNVNEVCQHCGNESGYTLIGKVGEAAPGEFAEEAPELETTDEMPVEEPEEDQTEEPVEDADSEIANELDGLDSLEFDLDLEDEEGEKKEEAFSVHSGEALVEELSDDTDLDAKLEAHNEYIEYLRAAIAQEEKALEKATNEQVKVAIQRNIDAFKTDLENALPEAVKNDTATAAETTDEPAEVPTEETAETQEESEAAPVNEALTEALQEEADLDISADEFEELINSPEFKKPISDTAARAMIASETEQENEAVEEGLDAVMSELDEIQESALESLISSSLVEAYGNVAGFRLAECAYADGKLTVDGTIYFTSGNTRKTAYVFNESAVSDKKVELRGLNEKLGLDKLFTLTGTISNKTLITESFKRN